MKRSLWLVGLVAVIPACGGSGDSGSGAGGGGNGATSSLSFADAGIETFPSEGNTHVDVGTVIQYHTDPPTSGNHFPTPQPGGFFTTGIPSGFLVHSLEHGAIVIYYDASRLSPDQLAHLKDLAATHPGNSAQIVVVPRNDPAFPIILTAWTHRLRLDAYDRARIDSFIALFLGHGPENG